MEGETEAGSGIGALRQERDTDTGYRRCRSARDTDAEECDTERPGMPIPKERGCQYEERREADAEECDTEGVGRWISRESNAEAECYQVMKPITQQQSV
jgi:hypothetical protein